MATIFSFFSGSGFLDLGFEHSNFNVGLVNEFHKPFMDAYKYSRKELKIAEPEHGYYLNSIENFIDDGDKFDALNHSVRAVQDSGELVGFIGGPPCPDFSVAGKNKGHEGENGQLTRTYIKTIIQHAPDFFLFENVKGLWRTAKHRAFYEEMKTLLQENGYVLTERLINCIQYGAPQDRDRILLFGVKVTHAKSLLNAQDLTNMLLPSDLFDWDAHIKYSREETLGFKGWPETNEFIEDNKLINQNESLTEITIEHWFSKNNVLEHPNALHHFKPISAKFGLILEGDTSKKSFKRLHRWRYSPTAAYGNNEVHLHPYKARRLSAAEALAIQSLPVEFSLPPTMTLSNMFKTIGNGVPYLAALGVANTINDFLVKIK
ncbi:MAG: DNA (cytosine-5)-methyltransferase 1 [Cocleimonas sp.]|jgi:DNA (cytosine-5)-methyltransferase 1